LDNWGIVYEQALSSNAQNIISGLKEVSSRFNLKVKDPSFAYCLQGEEKSLELFNHIKEHLKTIDILVIVLSRKSASKSYKLYKKRFNAKGIAT